jgi:alpha-D-ribose 1-methylphosphonate 5-triphosphate synthase subunit PhnH
MTTSVTFDTVFDSQQIFRLLLDSMSRPGKIARLPEISLEVPLNQSIYPVVILLTLMDHEVSFSLVDSKGSQAETDKIAGFVARTTGSKQVLAARADFVVVYGGNSGGAVLQCQRGSLSYPNDGATLIYEVAALSDREPCPMVLELTGPGIQNTVDLGVRGLDEADARQIIENRSEFPLGTDVILTDLGGRMACLPRSTRIKLRS